MKVRNIIFIIACMLLCSAPAIMTIFIPTTETTENKAMAKTPEIVKDETLNLEYLEECGEYFSDHMAFRNELIYADAMIQSKVFYTSSVESVVLGQNGWLYYESSQADYSGTGLLTEREIYNVAHNLELMQNYLSTRGISFAVTFAPNKSSLYSENLPFYEKLSECETHNIDLLAPILSEKEITYVNLFELFQNTNEILYLKRDSHWNLKGAQLAFSALMEEFELPYQEYLEEEKTINENGDLNKMLYNFYGDLEEGVTYLDWEQNYQYLGDSTNTEDGWVVTENKNQEHTLVMYRDSFANTLIPFLSNEFGEAYYSKGQPFALESYVETYQPDYVIYEKVERNIKDLTKYPPIITAPTAELPQTISICDNGAEVMVSLCENDANYIQISGEIQEDYLQAETNIIVRVNEEYYEAFHLDDNAFVAFLKKEQYASDELQIEIFTVVGEVYRRLYSEKISLGL